MSHSSCKRALDELLVGGDAEATQAAEAHVSDCPDCEQRVQRRERVARVIEAPATVGLDDLSKARLQARLLERISEEPDRQVEDTSVASPRRWFRWALAATVLLALGAGLFSQRSRLFGGDSLEGESLVAYVASGAAAAGTPALGKPQRRAAPGPGGVLRLAWYRDGERLATLELHGGEVVLGGKGELVQRGGLLLAQVAPQRHEALVVRAGATRVTVLGTVFSVDSRPSKDQAVGVLRGRVAVERSGMPRLELGAGQLARGGRSSMGLPPALREQLQRHAQATALPRGPRGSLILSGTPAGVEVHLGSSAGAHDRLGRSPLVALVPAGTTALRVSAPRRTSANLTVEVKTNDTIRLGYALALQPSPKQVATLQPKTAPPAPTASAAPRAMAPAPHRRRRRRASGRRTAPRAPRATSTTPQEKALPKPPPPSAAELYRRAEAAMAGQRDEAADGILNELLRAHPRAPEAASALLELGRRAAAQGAHKRARALLGRAERHPRAGTLARVAHFERCKVSLSTRNYKLATRCLRAFLKAYPRGGLVTKARLGLLRLALRAQRCDAARAQLRALQGGASTPLAQAAKLVRQRCPNKAVRRP